jgi:DNA-binding response OmpR family regulator
MRLLVIEDECDIRDSINVYLSEKGHTVDTAKDGYEGLCKALNWSYDLILIDAIVPKLNGFQVFTILRKKKNTPVIMIKSNRHIPIMIDNMGFKTNDFIERLGLIMRSASYNTSSMLSFCKF